MILHFIGNQSQHTCALILTLTSQSHTCTHTHTQYNDPHTLPHLHTYHIHTQMHTYHTHTHTITHYMRTLSPTQYQTRIYHNHTSHTHPTHNQGKQTHTMKLEGKVCIAMHGISIYLSYTYSPKVHLYKNDSYSPYTKQGH